jgi:hypothetical protein
VYCTTVTGCQPNCSWQIYHITPRLPSSESGRYRCFETVYRFYLQRIRIWRWNCYRYTLRLTPQKSDDLTYGVAEAWNTSVHNEVPHRESVWVKRRYSSTHCNEWNQKEYAVALRLSKKSSSTHRLGGWVGSKNGLGAVMKRKNLAGKRRNDSSIKLSPQRSHYTDCTTNDAWC